MLKSSFIWQRCLLASFLSLVAYPATAQDNNDQNISPPWSMADKYWGAEEMAKSRAAVQAANGSQLNSMVLADRLELQSLAGDEVLLWDMQAWYGGDVDKFYIKTEGEYAFDDDEIEDAEIQGLWSRAIAPFWDLQGGLRYDFEPKGETYAVLGVQGLAPYWFEIDAAAFVSSKGDLTARIEAEYELLLTQRLILQPRGEVELSAQDVQSKGIGAGLSSFSTGLRLRYEVKREIAPYIGFEWQKSLGNTADFARSEGEETDSTALILGLRAWF